MPLLSHRLRSGQSSYLPQPRVSFSQMCVALNSHSSPSAHMASCRHALPLGHTPETDCPAKKEDSPSPTQMPHARSYCDLRHTFDQPLTPSTTAKLAH